MQIDLNDLNQIFARYGLSEEQQLGIMSELNQIIKFQNDTKSINTNPDHKIESESIFHYGNRTHQHFENGGNFSKKITVKIGKKTYNVQVAQTELELTQGLQGRKNLPEDEGMLFDFNVEGNHKMWMKNTLFPLTQVFLNEDLEVIAIEQRFPNDLEQIGHEGTWYVLEINPTNSIKIGDTLEFDDEDEKDWVMQVLAPDGSSQMDLQGGERIISRKETKVLIRKAKKAEKLKSNNSYAQLGRYMFKVLDGQDNRDPEYVNSPD